MDEAIGFDLKGKELSEGMILSVDCSFAINFNIHKDIDPRQYCVYKGENGKYYLISVYDWWNKKVINIYEGREPDAEVPILVKPISEAKNYVVSPYGCGEDQEEFIYIYFDLYPELLEKVNNLIKKL